MSAENKNNNNKSTVDPSTGQFVDPLFAIFIAAAVAETIVPWTRGTWRDLNLFQICMVSLGFINILLSWFGYHKSVASKPIKGSFRFIITVILLPLYMLTIIMYKSDFFNIMIIYAIIFVFWSLWEYLRGLEYNERISFISIANRLYNYLVLFALVFLFITDYYSPTHGQSWLVLHANGVALTLLMFAIISLRVSKSMKNNGSPASKIKEEVLTLLFGARK